MICCIDEQGSATSSNFSSYLARVVSHHLGTANPVMVMSPCLYAGIVGTFFFDFDFLLGVLALDESKT